MPEGREAYQLGKAYTPAEAAKLAGTSAATVRTWLRGCEPPRHRKGPGPDGPGLAPDRGPLRLSFVELIEVVVVARFRQVSRQPPVTLARLDRARAYARDAFDAPFPFASVHLKEIGGRVMHEFETRDPARPGQLALALGGQWVLPSPVRDEVDENIDFDGQLAVRWYPAGRGVKLVVDPRIAGGRLCILGSGITVDTITKRWHAGEAISDLARDYDLPPADLEAILQKAA